MAMRKPELLAPAGNLEKLKFAIMYGADAVYIGGQQFGLRSKAGNFTEEDMKAGVEFAHQHGAKVYVAANIIAHNSDFEGMGEYFRTLKEIGIDAVIIADPAIVDACKEAAPDLEIHLSTQASIANADTIRFWAEEGVARVVLAREVTLDEIRAIRVSVDTEIEAFIHGAMCVSYSGRCVLSNHMTNRDANRGGCAQSCRWKYDLVDEDSGDELSEEGDLFTMGSKDLCMIEHIPDMIEAGVDSFKIEGRMKTIHYVATVVGVYRKAIDAYMADPEHYEFRPKWAEELRKAANRPVSTGLFYGDAGAANQIYSESPKEDRIEFAGLVLDYDEVTGVALVEQRNHFSLGQEVEFFGPKRETFIQRIESMTDEEGNALENAPHPLQHIKIKTAQPVQPCDMMRVRLLK